MSARTVGFIGGGRVASILIGGWARANALPGKVVVCDPNAEALARLKAKHGAIETTEDGTTAAAQDVVFIAVHPPVIPQALAPVKSALKPGAIVVSLAPKVTIAKLSEMLGGFGRVARMIPNAASIVGRGYNPVAFGAVLDAADRDGLKKLFAPWGECPEVAEAHLETYALLSGMGPTYFWPQICELKSLGESFGLAPQAALAAIDKMLWGAVAVMKDSGLTPDQVMDLIPVKPLADDVAALTTAMRTKLTGLMEKIRP